MSCTASRRFFFPYQFLSLVKDRVEARRSHPDLTDQDFEAGYGSYDWGAGRHAKFTNSKLTFLSLSMSETN